MATGLGMSSLILQRTLKAQIALCHFCFAESVENTNRTK